MRRLIYTPLCSLIVLLALSAPCHAGWFDQKETLFTLDGKEYSADDFRAWWRSWQEPGMSLPGTPGPFIDWTLLGREAERMKLYEDPEYQKKILTFLKARTLMLLKAEEVDGKINISDEDLWQKYREDYTPRYQINILFFNSRTDAEKLLNKAGPEPISDEQVTELAAGEDGPVKVETDWYRMITVDPGWREIINELEKGKLSDPVKWGKGVVILRLQEKNEGDRDDFATVQKEIYNTLRKEQANELTLQLIRSLREKYNVQVDHERLEKLDISAPDDSFTDQPVVTMDNGSISEHEFMQQVRRLQNFRNTSGFSDDNGYRYKEQVLNGIISQTLTTREGLAREYEKESPFKEIFDFYRRHRMIKTLEKRLFVPQVNVTPDQVQDYYENHIEKFSKPEMIRMIMVEGSPQDMQALWTEVAMGGDFRALVQKRFARPASIRELPLNHLEPEVREVVQKLTSGELSSVFTVNGHAALVQLVERIPAQPMPLARVEKQIHDLLYQKRMEQVRSDYLDKLRAGSSITVNSELWKKVRKELEEQDEKKNQ